MDDPNQIDDLEYSLWLLIYQAHNQGVRYENIHFILDTITKKVELQKVAENYLDNSEINTKSFDYSELLRLIRQGQEVGVNELDREESHKTPDVGQRGIIQSETTALTDNSGCSAKMVR